jgi:ketosteroid isomerase-like protein
MTIPKRAGQPAAGHSIESRLAQVEDRLAIRDLTARYNFAIDNRDLKSVGELFTDNGSFGSKDGAMRAVGRDAVLTQFESRFSVLGATNHFAHDHVIWFESATRARGQLSVHAEVWRTEQPMVTALRYDDLYEKSADGLWRFAERLLSFFYYVNVADYAKALGTLERNHASGVPVAADYPERLPTYVELRPGRSTS